MRLKVYSVAALSAGLFLFGGNSALAGSPLDTVKGQFENAKSTSMKTENIQPNFEIMKKSTSKRASVTSDSTNELLYEKEPNDTLSNANPLQLGTGITGKFHELDIDMYKISITEEGLLGVAGVMESTDSLSDIGFVLVNAKEEPVKWLEYYTEDHTLVVSYNVVPGTYYIKVFNTGEAVTEDLYGLATDMMYFGDVTPPEAPIVNRFDDNDTVLTGVSEPGATIEISSNGVKLGTTVADAAGRFAALINTHPEGTKLNIVAIDESENISELTNITVASSTYTGWVLEHGKWYYYIKGAPYHGWQYSNGKYYYLDLVSGAMKTGWIKDGANWYYLSNSGAMKTGWLKSGTKWYYLSNTGAMKTGWLKSGNEWYYLASSGEMTTGWIKSGNKWYYLYNNGKMAFNTKIGTYKLGSDGAWIQ